MPLFQYACEECGQTHELLIRGNEKPACPNCGSERLTRQMSAFAAVSSGSKSDAPGPPMGGCGAGCGCALN